MAQKSWRTSLIGMLATVALAACSPDEEKAAGNTPEPSAPAQEMPPPDSSLAESPPPAPAEQTSSRPSAPIEQPKPEGKAILSWEPPTQYTDGATLPVDQLAGFVVYHGTSESKLEPLAELDRYALSMTVEDLTSGTHFFAVTALTTSGIESGFSAIGSKQIM